MKTIKTYPTSVEAELARIALNAADIPAVVVGISVGMEGGGAGVQLLVPDDMLEQRRLRWQPPEPKSRTGYLARYAALVGGADQGAVLSV